MKLRCPGCGKEIEDASLCPSCRERHNSKCDTYRKMMESVKGKDYKTQLDAINRFRSGEWR